MNSRAMMKTSGASRLEPPVAMRMLRAVALDWSMLVRRLRGTAGDAGFGGEWFGGGGAAGEILPRRRRDRHPDAPPRQPLFASRDLPPPDVTRVATLPAGDPVAPPRAPEPMSEAQIAQLLAAAMARPVPVPDPVTPLTLIRPVPAGAPPEPHWPRLARCLPRVAEADLAPLVDRLDQATTDHADATLLAPVAPEAGAMPAAPADSDAAAVEAALAKALATLRKLTEQEPPNRRR